MDSVSPIEMFTCTKCGEEKSVKDFRTSNTIERGHAAMCKACVLRGAHARHERNLLERERLLAAGANKTCVKCGLDKPIIEFTPSKAMRAGSLTRCKTCVNVKHGGWRARSRNGAGNQRARVPMNKEKLKAQWKRRRLRAKYNLTVTDRQLMLAAQEFRCAICEEPFDLEKGTMHNVAHIDHNHTTGQIRGILCSKCNFGIGQFRENCLILVKAIEYLKKYEDTQ